MVSDTWTVSLAREDGDGSCKHRYSHEFVSTDILVRIIEGIPTIVLGIAVWWWLADDPEHAPYLSQEERQLMIVRKQRQSGYSKTSDQFLKQDVITGLKDWKIWVFCIGQFGVDTM